MWTQQLRVQSQLFDNWINNLADEKETKFHLSLERARKSYHGHSGLSNRMNFSNCCILVTAWKKNQVGFSWYCCFILDWHNIFLQSNPLFSRRLMAPSCLVSAFGHLASLLCLMLQKTQKPRFCCCSWIAVLTRISQKGVLHTFNSSNEVPITVAHFLLILTNTERVIRFDPSLAIRKIKWQKIHQYKLLFQQYWLSSHLFHFGRLWRNTQLLGKSWFLFFFFPKTNMIFGLENCSRHLLSLSQQVVMT